MQSDFLTKYFRKLRMLHCSELQLISFFPYLASRAHDVTLQADFAVAMGRCRQRRDQLELIAERHRICIAGNDCSSMRRLIGESRSAMRGGSWHFPGDDLLRTINGSVHRLLAMNYGMTRTLAGRTRQRGDLEHLDAVLEELLDRFPESFETPFPAGMLQNMELAPR